MYSLRFEQETNFRKKMWSILCKEYFQRYIKKSDTVLDVAAGHGEFINNIKAKKKIAIDLNPDTKKFASKEVDVIINNASNMNRIKINSIDFVFISNFFEHLEKSEIIKVVIEVKRVLRKNGRLLILQPNYRFCYKNYWNFFDHITPLDDRSMVELLKLNGFEIIKVKPKFLPFSTKGMIKKIFPDNLLLFILKLVLKINLLQKLLGGQMLIYSKNKK